MAGAIEQLGMVGLKEGKEHKKNAHRPSDLLWKEFFRDPARWWDNRHSKSSPAFPDFKHKATKEPLWIDDYNPPWVCKELTRRGLAASPLVQNTELFLKNGRHTHDTGNDESASLVILLRACAKSKDLQRGTRIHNDILEKGLLEECSDALVTMYAKCGVPAKAKELLDMHCSRDVYTWTALISAYARHGQNEDALKCFERMQHMGLSADAVTFASILKVCGSLRAADKGKQIHDEIARLGLLKNDVVLGTALVNMYVKCGALDKAQHAIEELPSRDTVSWNCLISGYTQQGQAEQALTCFHQMCREQISPDALTLVCILKACGSIGDVKIGEQIHDEAIRKGMLKKNTVLGTAVVHMYAKCGLLAKAQEVLEKLPSRDAVSWSVLIACYTEQGQGEKAFECFERMQREGLAPDRVTFISILKACATIGAAHKGKEIHDEIAKQGLLKNDVVLGTALVDMYAKCGALSKAEQVLEELPFQDVAPWSALIAGYVQHGHSKQALSCFERMRHAGLSPDAATFNSILTACGSIKALEKGEMIHDEIARQGLLRSNIMIGTALVDMYAKCGALAKARQVLKDLPFRNAVSWNSIITGYTQLNKAEEAVDCFEQMQHEGLSPDAVTFACILNACGSLGAADKGKQIHHQIAKQGLLENDIVLGTALVDMYAKCGALTKAQQIHEELRSRNLVSWNALITGYAQHGQSKQVLKCFEQMQHEGLSPNAITLTCVLNACNHFGLVEDGHFYFANMSTKCGVKPALEHYTCMVDLFGRAGHLDKAVSVIQEMPFSYYSAILCGLLGACRKWGDVNVGRWAFEHALHVDKSDGAAYILMADIYAAAGMPEDAKNIEALKVKKQALVS